MSEFHTIQLSSALRKAVVIVFVVAIAAASWLTVRRTLGVTVAVKADSKELAEIGVGLAPDNGFAHFMSGLLLEKTFLPDDLVRSQAEFEKAVQLSPADFRLWLELARSYEKSGDLVKSEASFRKALELAPNYSRVQWAVGNFLLRIEKSDEAFQLIKSAAARDFTLASAASAVAWNIYGGDLETIERFFAGSDYLQAGLAAHLAEKSRFDDALRIWAALPAEKRESELQATSETIYRKLSDEKRYLLVLKMDELAGRGGKAPGSVTNGGFEEEIRLTNPDRFGWQFAEGADAQIGIDAQQVRNGTRQRVLAMLFDLDGRSFRSVSQLVPVEPGQSYSFSLAYRSDLSSKATMKWEIVDAADSKLLASTEVIADKSDWTELKVEFTVPVTSEGIVMRLVRTGCTSVICPLAGKVWFDDVAVSRR